MVELTLEQIVSGIRVVSAGGWLETSRCPTCQAKVKVKQDKKEKLFWMYCTNSKCGKTWKPANTFAGACGNYEVAVRSSKKLPEKFSMRVPRNTGEANVTKGKSKPRKKTERTESRKEEVLNKKSIAAKMREPLSFSGNVNQSPSKAV